ncbi:MAG: TIGR02444 family protein [Alphaproteobacteria bacterium]|nr:TIGR02444 family protein [Alphaproteobacteria bacterium]
MSDPPGNAFWNFSLRAYARPGVADACIRLQDRYGVDVNVLFYLQWLATVRPAPLDDGEVAAILAETEDWRETVVKPLRAIRRRMKSGYAGFAAEDVAAMRSEIKRLELQSERQEHDFLYAREGRPVPDAAPADACAPRAADNVAAYLRVLGVAFDAAGRGDCETVLAGCSAG